MSFFAFLFLAVPLNDILFFAAEHVNPHTDFYWLLKLAFICAGLAIGIGMTTQYEFWGSRINQALNAALKREKSGILINLASVEYFKAVQANQLRAKIVTPVFKEYRDSSYRVVAIYAKKARGLMCDYMVRNHMTRARDLNSFDLDGYRLKKKLSSEEKWVFTRGKK